MPLRERRYWQLLVETEKYERDLAEAKAAR